MFLGGILTFIRRTFPILWVSSLAISTVSCQLPDGTSTLPSDEETPGPSSGDSSDSEDSTASAPTDLVVKPNANPTVYIGDTYQFVTTGGTPPYTYAMTIGAGTLDPVTGLFTPPPIVVPVIATVTDSGTPAKSKVLSIDVTYHPLAISPTTKNVVTNATATFTATGGHTPHTFSVASGSGSINSATGVYTAPAGSGSAVIRVTDIDGRTANAAVTIIFPLAISPAAPSVLVNTGISFSATGGVSPYVYSLVSGVGSINSSTGAYTGSASPGSAVVRVTDLEGRTSTANVTIVNPLQISPTTKNIVTNANFTFTASGGNAPLTYSVPSGGGSVNAGSGQYTAPGTSGVATVRVTDIDGRTSNAAVTIVFPLTISPSTSSTLVSTTVNFSATGGVSPYTYSVLSGVGSINASSGVYTAPGTPGTATVRVTDSEGRTSDAPVTVVDPLQISPTTKNIVTNANFTFSATGGNAPLSYSIASGVGSINASSGQYTAAAAPGVATVRVTDVDGRTSDAAVTVVFPLAISPSSSSTLISTTINFSASGGVSPYTYSVFSGVGSVNGASGVYTAPGSTGTATVRVTDSEGRTSDASVIVVDPLQISPTTKNIVTSTNFTFSATGGNAPLTYSIASGVGSINSSSGQYTAPAAPGVATVRVTDVDGRTSDAAVTVVFPLAISPTSSSTLINTTVNFSASGGVSAYTYSVFSGVGSVNGASGVYTAPGTPGTATVRVTDSEGRTSDASVTVVDPLQISPTTKNILTNATFTFSATGGNAPLSYSIASGVGSINSSSGLYTAPAAPGIATVRVTDVDGRTSDAAVTVVFPLAISPVSGTILVNDTVNFSASGGVSAYTYSVFAGTGSVNAASGVYTAPAVPGTATVRVTDSEGRTSNASLTIVDPLVISPATKNIVKSTSYTFNATGGNSTLTFSISAGGGSINSSTGQYTAPGAVGSATVRVTDIDGTFDEAAVTIVHPLAISPSTTHVVTNDDVTFSASGGVTPVTYSVVAGGGSVDPNTGEYTAPAATGNATVRATDPDGLTSDASIVILDPLQISPATKNIVINATFTFSASGGDGTYTYSIAAGAGSINASSGLYTAGAVAGSVTVRVTDGDARTSDSAVTLVDPLAISPSSKNILVNGTHTFSASGGVAPYSYSIVAGGGSINAGTGAFTAPNAPANTTVRVTDSEARTSDAAVNTVDPVEISPTNVKVIANKTVTFSAVDGVAPYTYSVVSGNGTINAGTGVFTAAATNGTSTVRVTDSMGETNDTTLRTRLSKQASLLATQTTNSTNLNQATAYPLSWSTSSVDPVYFTHSTGANPEQLTVKIAGDYLLTLNLPVTSADTNVNLLTEVRVNGVNKDFANSYSGGIRNTGSHSESSEHLAILLDGLSVNDVVEVYTSKAASAGTVNVSGNARLHVEYVDTARTLYWATASQTTNSANLNQAAPWGLSWTELIKDAGFTHSNVTNPDEITLDNAGDYLVYVNLPLTSTTAQANVMTTVLINGVAVDGGPATQGVISTSGSLDKSSEHWFGIIPGVSAGAVLKVTTALAAAAGTVTVPASTVGSIFVEKLDTSANTYWARGNDLVGGNDWNPAASDPIRWTTDTITDAATYDHSTVANPHQVTVKKDGDYLLLYQDSVTASTADVAPKIRVKVNGAAVSGAETKTHYIENTNGHVQSSATMAVFLENLNANDVVTVEAIQEATAGTVDDVDDAILTLVRK